jgi:hypothetical protein
MPITLHAALFTLFSAFAPVTGDELRLARALEAVDANQIRADVFFFASDELRGRDTPSPEQRVAARFVRARLERHGFQPGAGASFFHEYPLLQRRIDPALSRLELRRPDAERAPAADGSDGAPVVLEFARDYFVPTGDDVTALDRAGGVVYCGKGERADFERASLAGKWALCVASDLQARRRARYAQGAQALGLILVPDPLGRADPAEKECARATQYALAGMSSLAPRDDELLPQVHLSLPAARRLLASAGLERLPAVGTALELTVRDVRAGSGTIALENVCGLWPGSDPELAKDVIVLSAHYDHDGVKNGVIYPGADDNASGSMGLLAVAEALAEYGPMRRSVLLMWVSGEEKGLWGSNAWTEAPVLPAGHRVVCNVNVDMIGRNAPGTLLITPTRSHKAYNGLSRLAERLAPLEGFPQLGDADDYWARSDHMNFAVDLEVPVAFLFSGEHEDYHRPTDTPDKLDCDKIRRVVRLVVRMLDGLQGDVLDL